MATIHPSNQVRTPERTFLLDTLIGEFSSRCGERTAAHAPVAFISDKPLMLVAAAAWLAHTQTDGLLLPRERLSPVILHGLRERGYAITDIDAMTIQPANAPPTPVAGRISLLTSGTTGTPKLIQHTWESLFTMRRARQLPPRNWLLTYQSGTYAWFQLVTLAFFGDGQSLTVSDAREPADFFAAAAACGVDAISATPTFWRLALMQIPRDQLRALSLKQITLGGERVDQIILDQLKQLYPTTTVAHIYASSEAGACIVVRDGREGFPSQWLTQEGASADDAPQLQVRDGYLWIRSPHASLQHNGWFNSGDAVELRGDRVMILGRANNSLINVGGLKVVVSDVERELLQHPAVAWCRVYARRSPVIGELVAVDVVAQPGATTTEAALTAHCASRLNEHMVPRLWRFLERIPATDNLKTELV